MDGPDHTPPPQARCAWCNKPIQRTGRRGPAPTYCPGSRCRTAHYRHNRDYVDWELRHGIEPPEPTGLTVSDLDTQAATTILEARTLAGISLRLGREARPAIAWRFARLGEGLEALLDRLFPADDEGTDT